MDLRCPKCNSNNLKKVSLAYQEGTYLIDTRSRMRGLLFAGGGRVSWSVELPRAGHTNLPFQNVLSLPRSGRM